MPIQDFSPSKDIFISGEVFNLCPHNKAEFKAPVTRGQDHSYRNHHSQRHTAHAGHRMRMASFLKFGNKAMKTQHHLDEYRQHKEVHVYRPVRWIGYGSYLAALSFGIFALVNRSWRKAEIAGTGTYLLHSGTPVHDTTFDLSINSVNLYMYTVFLYLGCLGPAVLVLNIQPA